MENFKRENLDVSILTQRGAPHMRVMNGKALLDEECKDIHHFEAGWFQQVSPRDVDRRSCRDSKGYHGRLQTDETRERWTKKMENDLRIDAGCLPAAGIVVVFIRLLAALTKSCKSCRLFPPAAGIVRVQVGFNLVDFFLRYRCCARWIGFLWVRVTFG